MTGTSKSGDSAKPECFQMLTQPLKFCTSVTKRCPLLFILLPLSSPFTPSSSCPESPPPPVLSARFAELWWRHTTGRGQRRGQCISLALLSSPSHYSDWFPVSLTVPLMSPLQPFPLFTFNTKTSALLCLLVAGCQRGVCFFLDGCCLGL